MAFHSKRRLPEKISDTSKNCCAISLPNIFTYLKLCDTIPFCTIIAILYIVTYTEEFDKDYK